MADVVIEFSAVVSITDGTGITIQTTGGKVFAYASHMANGTSFITFIGTWDIDISPNDVVTFEYDGFIGNIVDGSIEAIKSISETVIINCLYVPPSGSEITDASSNSITDASSDPITDGS